MRQRYSQIGLSHLRQATVDLSPVRTSIRRRTAPRHSLHGMPKYQSRLYSIRGLIIYAYLPFKNMRPYGILSSTTSLGPKAQARRTPLPGRRYCRNRHARMFSFPFHFRDCIYPREVSFHHQVTAKELVSQNQTLFPCSSNRKTETPATWSGNGILAPQAKHRHSRLSRKRRNQEDRLSSGAS